MICFNDPRAIRAISRAVNVPFIPTHHQCIARFDAKGKLLGGVFFTDYNIASIMIHVVGFEKNWIDRRLWWVSLDYPFNKLNCKKIIATVQETNTRCLDFCFHTGFTLEARVPDVFPDCGMMILGLYKSDVRRFLEMRPPRLTIAGNAAEDSDGKKQPAT